MNDTAAKLERVVERARYAEQSGQRAQAIFAWCEALAIAPREANLRIEYASLLFRLGQVAAAMEEFKTAETNVPDDARAPLGMALCAFQAGDHHLSAERATAALALQPDLHVARIFLARAKIGLNDAEAAAESLKPLHAQQLTVEDANEYAVACIALGDYSHAESALIQAMTEAPDDPSLRTNLALVCERKSRFNEASDLLAGIKQLDFTGEALSARLILRNKQYELALGKFQRLRESVSVLDHQSLAEIDNGIGRCLDGLERYAEAFNAFSSCNLHDQADFMKSGHAQPRSLGDYPWLQDDPAADFERTASIAESARSAPVFLVGFPRSGTTLIDQLLDAHPALSVAEELPLVEAAVKAMNTLDGDHTFEERLRIGRDAFWHAVDRLSPLAPGKQLVDKFPFNLARAQIIQKLFPDAKWIFAIRHPGDVMLSCFMQRFRYTDATQGFWQLDSIDSIYHATMDLWLRQKARLGLTCMDLRYEDFVAEPEAGARRLIEFLGLPWQQGILSTDEHAKTRWVATPSYDQVTQPINTRAVGRWMKYHDQLQPALPTIRQWAETLGYGSSQASHLPINHSRHD